MNKLQPGRPILYRWALDDAGRPLAIEKAQRGRAYTCPLCRGPMVARLGEERQHHYSHELLTNCTPEAVDRAALRRWIVILLQEALASRQPVSVQWTCPRCGGLHRASVLEGVAGIAEDIALEGHRIDIALMSTPNPSSDHLRGAIFIQDSPALPPAALQTFAARNIVAATFSAASTPTEFDVLGFQSHLMVQSGPCPIWKDRPDLLRDPEPIRTFIREVVSRWPGYFYAAIENVEGLADVARVGECRLWVPLAHWTEVIGGTRHRLAPDVSVLMQVWEHRDGGQTLLYHVTANQTKAIAGRRYGTGAVAMPAIDIRFRHKHTTALDIARHLVTKS